MVVTCLPMETSTTMGLGSSNEDVDSSDGGDMVLSLLILTRGWKNLSLLSGVEEALIVLTYHNIASPYLLP